MGRLNNCCRSFGLRWSYRLNWEFYWIMMCVNGENINFRNCKALKWIALGSLLRKCMNFKSVSTSCSELGQKLTAKIQNLNQGIKFLYFLQIFWVISELFETDWNFLDFFGFFWNFPDFLEVFRFFGLYWNFSDFLDFIGIDLNCNDPVTKFF